MAPSARLLLERGNNLALDAFSGRVVTRMRDAGVPSLLLRGPAIARALYDDADIRTYVDIDLLVAPHRFPEAERIMASLGLKRLALEATIPGDRTRHADTWRVPENGLMVDLHRTVYGVRAPLEVVWTRLAARGSSIDLGGASVRVLDPPGLALVIVLHAAQHGVVARAGMSDLERALERYPPPVWSAAERLARELEADAAFASGLRLVPTGAQVADALGLTASPTVETELRAGSAPELALTLEWLRSEASRQTALRVLARKAFPAAAFMRAWSPLAGSGRPGLLVAYAWRPVWLLWQAVPAVRAWRRAVKSAHNPRT